MHTELPAPTLHPLDIIRFQPERALIDDLFDRFSLDTLARHIEERSQNEPGHDLVVSTQLRLTPLLAPRLCALFEEVKERLHFKESVELFVHPDSDVNGFSMHTTSEGKPHVVSLTSGLVERMTDDELRFVMGHELAHLHFRHHRPLMILSALGQDDEDSRVPPLLMRRLETWERLAELSCDRAGFVAVSGRLESVVSAFFKMISGLGPEHLRFDMEAFLAQLNDLQKMKRRDVLARFSHPATPVRVRALQIFGQNGGGKLPDEQPQSPLEKVELVPVEEAVPARRSSHRRRVQLSPVDAEISKLAELMEFEVTEPLEIHARDFLLSAGILAAHADGRSMSHDEYDLLLNLLLPLTANPEAQLQRVRSEIKAEKMLQENAAWLKENAGEERFLLFRQLANMVAIDGVLTDSEKNFMLEVARLIDIPVKSATESLYDVLAGFLQSRPRDRTTPFRTRRRRGAAVKDER